MFEGLMLMIGLCGVVHWTAKLKHEDEERSEELENIRHYLLDKYQDELKHKYPENNFDYTAKIIDVCLKLRNMDNDVLEMAYNKAKEQDSK